MSRSCSCRRRRRCRGNIVINGRGFNGCELDNYIRKCCPRNVVINGSNRNGGGWAALLALWFLWL